MMLFMMKSQVVKFMDSLKTKKFKYLKNETQILTLIKELINCTFEAILWGKKDFPRT